MGRPDSILGQFGETVRCRDAQHGDNVSERPAESEALGGVGH